MPAQEAVKQHAVSEDASIKSKAATLLFALSAGFYWMWWDSFHELYRFTNETIESFATFLYGGIVYLQCITESGSLFLGSALILLTCTTASGLSLMKRLGLSQTDARAQNGFAKAVFVFQILLTLANGLVRYSVEKDSIIASVIYAFATILFVVVLFRLGLTLRELSLRQCGEVFIGAAGVCALFNNFIFPIFMPDYSILLLSSMYALVVVLAYVCEWYAQRMKHIASIPVDCNKTYGPWRLGLHLALYGFVFGLLHILEGLIQRGRYSVNIGVFFGAVLAIIIFCILFLRKDGAKGLWSKMQSTVFPLVLIGFVLVPQLVSKDTVLAFTEAGHFLFIGYMVFGTQIFMRRTDMGDLNVLASALLFYSLGKSIGVIAGVYISPTFDASAAEFALLTTLVIVLLTIATFWMGSAEQVRKLWGMRRNLSPKRYNDLVLQGRIAALTQTYGLTPREAEALKLVAQGKHAPEIRDAMGVSMYTARTHLRNLYTKTGAHSYAEVVRLLEATSVEEEGWKV